MVGHFLGGGVVRTFYALALVSFRTPHHDAQQQSVSGTVRSTSAIRNAEGLHYTMPKPFTIHNAGALQYTMLTPLAGSRRTRQGFLQVRMGS
jgi:hypothetical protein